MSPIEKNPQPIRDLVPKDISFESLEGIKNLPHLPRVAGLVYLLLEGEARINRQFTDEFERFRDPALDETQISFTDFVLSQNPESTLLISEILKGKTLPEILAEKLNEHGDPFGFGPELTRAILEMAKDSLKTLEYCNAVSTDNPERKPDPRNYLDDVMIRMFEEGRLSGLTPFSNTKFPAGTYHREIFPREVRQQMRDYIDQMYPVAKNPPDKRLSL